MSTTAYDVVEYPGGVFPQTHPSRLAAIARLHGVPAASPARCRVLEIGTSDGGNLLPMALAYPQSEFVGIDLSEPAVAKGDQSVAALGLKNLTLRAEDLCTLPDSFGRFDYVLAHGVFSWVPDPVRDALLALCRRVLTPNGVAYVSYNTLPGGHVSQMLAEMMRYHTRRMTAPEDQLQQARALMRIVHDGTNVPGPMGEMLKKEARRVFEDFGDPVLYHDDLAEENRRFYFHEFAERADRHDLQFLAEADYHELSNAGFAAPAADLLATLGKQDRVLQEQYRDFLCLRRFRQSLLVRREVEIDEDARFMEVAGFFVTANPLTPESTDLTPGVRVRFESKKGSLIELDHPLTKAVLLDLAALPNVPRPVEEVVASAARRLGRDPSAVPPHDRKNALYTLFQTFGVGLVQMAVDPPRFAVEPGPRPTLSPLVRHQIESGREHVTTLRHGTAHLGTELTRQLALACDGERDRAAILERVLEWARSRPPVPGQPAESADQLRTRLGGELEAGLRAAAALALLTE